MVVAAGDTWNYFPGTAEPPSNWKIREFQNNLWLSGAGGFGYGDNDDDTTISPVPSVYLRINFDLVDTSNISWAFLDVDYDDAFVAYLNGHEIARANIGTAEIEPPYTAYSNSDHEAKLYQGGIPERFVIHKDTLRKCIYEEANVLALQFHNANST